MKPGKNKSSNYNPGEPMSVLGIQQLLLSYIALFDFSSGSTLFLSFCGLFQLYLLTNKYSENWANSESPDHTSRFEAFWSGSPLCSSSGGVFCFFLVVVVVCCRFVCLYVLVVCLFFPNKNNFSNSAHGPRRKNNGLPFTLTNED